jgi:hypothetical protein
MDRASPPGVEKNLHALVDRSRNARPRPSLNSPGLSFASTIVYLPDLNYRLYLVYTSRRLRIDKPGNRNDLVIENNGVPGPAL